MLAAENHEKPACGDGRRQLRPAERLVHAHADELGGGERVERLA